VINGCFKGDLGWFEWVVGGKQDFEFENAAFIGCFSGSNDGRFPIEEVIIMGSRRAIDGGILLYFSYFFLETLKSHL